VSQEIIVPTAALLELSPFTASTVASWTISLSDLARVGAATATSDIPFYVITLGPYEHVYIPCSIVEEWRRAGWVRRPTIVERMILRLQGKI